MIKIWKMNTLKTVNKEFNLKMLNINQKKDNNSKLTHSITKTRILKLNMKATIYKKTI